jgi:hypothetical protein
MQRPPPRRVLVPTHPLLVKSRVPPDLLPSKPESPPPATSLPEFQIAEPKPIQIPALHPVKHKTIRKGYGTESKRFAPDPHDNYSFRTKSLAFARIVHLGFQKVTLTEVVRICNLIENFMRFTNRRMTERNRAARRRTPCAFHWLDANLPLIGMLFFDNTVMSVMGGKAGKKRQSTEAIVEESAVP